VTASTFLAPAEIAELTGVRIGKKGRTREQLQSAELTRMRVPHFLNVAGRVVVARAIIEGRPAEPAPRRRWEPSPA
jgi:hypothetical protein